MAISLKKGEKVSLKKTAGGSLGEIHVNLNWDSHTTKKGAMSAFMSSLLGVHRGIDLDLGCLYELKNGRKGAVQALGNAFGAMDSLPFIMLDGDDRTGNSVGGENLRINGNHIADLKRILIFTFIYEGAANWKDAEAVVTIKVPGEEELIVEMDNYNTGKKMCALALLENVKNETFSVEKQIQFFNGHVDMDKHYDWGIRWKAGRK